MNCSGKFTNNTCPQEWDGWIKWPETCPGQNATMDCPKIPETLRGAKAIKICNENGTWEWNSLTNNTKSHYEMCIMPKFQDIARMCNQFGNNACKQIAKVTRSLEMTGLSVSLVSLTIGLYIFSQYRILRNNRTKIHINLFISTLLHVVFRLIKYTDQFLQEGVLQKVPFLDKTCIALLEYTRTAMFMWMFIEGLYLHNLITVTVFQEYTYIKLYFYLGWTGAGVMTLIWLVTMLIKADSNWKIYYFFDYYWILEGPRCTIILVNFLFLFNIIRVLVVKLRESHTSEIEQVRKAVRAAIFLLPLLGTPNLLFQINYIYDEAWKFSLWSYVTYSLNSFQGFFVAVLYCFLNGEVQTAIKNSYYLRQSLRSNEYTPCRNFTLISIGHDRGTSPKKTGLPQGWFGCCKKVELSSPEGKDMDLYDMNERRDTAVLTAITTENHTDDRLKKEEWSRISHEETNSSIVEEKHLELKM
ncbi:PDF receptor [Aethina tumida]|uniref:PDF receptor n=1 Tax=Aethina tumida TaxID=116153 RepID=UPI002148BDDA|nr:PDF receptor [Aethina tumida]